MNKFRLSGARINRKPFLFMEETMASPTLAQQLEAVETAIHNVMTGGAVQSYSINGRNINRMNLSELTTWRDKLIREISAQTTGGSVNYVTFCDPT